MTESASSAHDDMDATLAPRSHTAALVGLLLAVALTGTLLQLHGAPTSAVVPEPRGNASPIFARYFPLLVVNWSLVVYCSRLFRDRNVLPDLLGRRWHTLGRAFTDLACALVGFFVILGVEFAFARLFVVRRNAAIAALLPSTGAERLTWIVVAVSVGFCEEVVYRGYLQTQIAALTRSRALGVILQALIFGLAHLEQGPAAAARIAGYGLLLGALAQFRRSLLPGIACHVALDLVAGLR